MIPTGFMISILLRPAVTVQLENKTGDLNLLGLRPPCHQQKNPSHQTNSAHNWPNRHAMLFLFVQLERSQLRDIFLGRVFHRSEPAISQGDYANRDQNNSDNTSWFHKTILKRPAACN